MSFTIIIKNHSFLEEHISLVLLYFSENVKLDISCELYARQRVHKKFQPYFLRKKKKKINKNIGMLSVVVISALRVEFSITLQPLYNTVHYNTVLDITLF